MIDRRRWMLGGATAAVGMAGATAGTLADPHPIIASPPPSQPIVSTQTYPWRTFAARAGRPHVEHSDGLLAAIAASGITGYEPIVDAASELKGLGPRLRSHGLVMPSVYVNSTLHDPQQSAASIDAVLAIGEVVRDLGTSIVVTNPSPIRWGGDENKNDEQLRHQAISLDGLGRGLSEMGLSLAYHNHDAELRQGGREFHHMLTATDPRWVKLCFDAHWVFTGCGDSELAVYDALDHYVDRVIELHLRQSEGGVWTQSFTIDSDIDYNRIFRTLADNDVQPRLVLEQSIEDATEVTQSVIECHQRSLQALA